MPARKSPSQILQYASLAVLALGGAMCAVYLIYVLGAGPTGAEAIIATLGKAFGFLGLSAGLAGLLYGISKLVERGSDGPARLIEKLDRIEDALNQVAQQVQKLRQQGQAAATPPDPTLVPPSSSSLSFSADGLQWDKVVTLLEDIRNLSMMTEQQRQAFLREHLLQRKKESIDEISKLVLQQQWARAHEVLHMLEEQFPDDEEVNRSRRELEAGRAMVEQEAFEQARRRVDELMSISSWDQALMAARGFVDNFPNNEEGKHLLERVMRERELFRESTVGKIYHEIRFEIDHRNWRKALTVANRLIEQYPDHPRTHVIRQQLQTITENAEIEERQEQEVRIQELIRSKRLTEAIDMAEDLIHKYPESPQAESLERMLPQLRDLAEEIRHSPA